jgi:peptide/nickel transport system substrate-binding protein
LRDAQAQVNALAKGEVDVLERPAFESYEQLKQAPGVALVNKDPLGFQYMCRFNHLHPPFNNPKVRQAALAAMPQEPFLRAQVGIKEFYRPCAVDVHLQHALRQREGQRGAVEVEHEEGAGAPEELGLRRHAGAHHEADRPRRDPEAARCRGAAPAAGRLQGRPAGHGLEQRGVAPREEGAAGAGRLEHLLHRWVAPDIWNPLANAAIGGAGEKSWFGWPTDAELEKLRDEFARATEEPKKKALAEAIQARAFEIGTHAPLGEYVNPLAARKNVTGWVIGPGDIYWNVKKNGD